MNNKNEKLVHDINNLLANIMLTAELLTGDPKAKREAKKIISDAKKIAQLAKKIIA